MIAIGIALSALVWIGSGVLFQADEKKGPQENIASSVAAEEGSSENIMEVRVRNLSAEIVHDSISITGKTLASRKLHIRAETDGQIVQILVEKGTLVQSGQPIAKLELRDRAARVQEAQQLLKQREIQYKAAKELALKGFNSRVRLAEAQAQLESAKATLKEMRVDLDKTTIKAPFDGILNEQFVEVGDYVSKGTEVFAFVDLDPIEVEGFLTEGQVAHIHLGDKARAQLLGGEQMEGEITYISSVADSDARTFPVEISIPNPGHTIKEGLTAEIRISMEEKRAYKISPSILSLADNGQIGVKIVDENDRVQFKPVALLKDTPEHLWITGLPPSVRIITVGQEFVLSGQKVKPVLSEDDGLL